MRKISTSIIFEEISNPFPEHVNAPVMAQTSYLQDQRVIKIDVKKSTEKRGKIITEILKNGLDPF